MFTLVGLGIGQRKEVEPAENKQARREAAQAKIFAATILTTSRPPSPIEQVYRYGPNGLEPYNERTS